MGNGTILAPGAQAVEQQGRSPTPGSTGPALQSTAPALPLEDSGSGRRCCVSRREYGQQAVCDRRTYPSGGRSHISAMHNELVFIGISVADNTSGQGTMKRHEDPPTDWHSLEPSCILILLITGKVIMNVFIFWARHSNVSASLMGYCCISVAIIDFILLFAISAIHCFQDFTVLGFRFTNYHICLLTQIISHTYSILHLPFFLASGLDYYVTIVKSVQIPYCSGLLYTTWVLLLWTAAFAYVLMSPLGSPELDTGQSTYQCNFYISNQSFYLSTCLICSILMAFAVCCSEILTFLRSLKVMTYSNNTVILFSFPPGNGWPVQGGKRLMATLLFSFLGIWAPFAVLQIIILVLCVPIPGYMDMNVPWLYFMNSFIIGVCLGIKYPDLQVTAKIFSIDPFIVWKYCVLPFMDAKYNKGESLLREFPPSIMII